jgi:hypothetical protein
MSVTKERQETYYARPNIKTTLEAYVKLTGESKSGVVNKALKEMFNNLPQNEKDRLNNLSKSK